MSIKKSLKILHTGNYNLQTFKLVNKLYWIILQGLNSV